MSPAVDYLSVEDLLWAVEQIFGTVDVVADHGLLIAAVARPKATVFGADAYPTISGKAAALMHSLITSHPLVDGNKRLGTAAMLLFYELNGVAIRASDDELFDVVMAVADGSLRDVPRIAEILRRWEDPISLG